MMIRNVSKLLVVVSLVCMSAWSFGDATSQYRLSGIISSTQGSSAAVIESENGEEHFYLPGDPIDDGIVSHIYERQVMLTFGNGTVVLMLKGLPPEKTTSKPTHVLSAESVDGIVELQNAGELPGREELLAKINSLMGLSRHSEITYINNKAVTSAAEILQLLAENLTTNRAVAVTANQDGPSGPQRVVLFEAAAPAP